MAQDHTDPGEWLGVYPCRTRRCLSRKEQLASMIWVIENFIYGSVGLDWENTLRKYRDMSEGQMFEIIIAHSAPGGDLALTSDDLKCLVCYSEAELEKIWLYLISLLVTPGPT